MLGYSLHIKYWIMKNIIYDLLVSNFIYCSFMYLGRAGFSFLNWLSLVVAGWGYSLVAASFVVEYRHKKTIAPHSSTLAWKILWTEEPCRLQSMGLLRVGYDWVTSLSLLTFLYWRRKWQPTPVFLPGESQGRRSLVGCHLCSRTESDTTDAT